jgi:small subunit ribosomal protein S4
VKKGDVVTMKEASQDLVAVQHSVDTLDRVVPEWLDVDAGDRKVSVRDVPDREQIDTAIQEQLIVELYSK